MPELIHAEPGSPEWLAARRQGVTATDIVTILGLSSYDSPYSLFWRKLDQIPEQPDNDRMRLGRELEPYVMARWGEEHPDMSYDLMGPTSFRSSDRPWQMATPDSVIYYSEGVTGTGEEVEPSKMIGTLEVKTWADAAKDHWQDGPPPKVRAQVLWQMDVMDVPVGHVGVLFLPSGEFRSYVIEHDDHSLLTVTGRSACSVCADLGVMREYGEEFMSRLRLELPPPDPDASAATLAAQRARFARQPDKAAEVDLAAWNGWRSAKDELDAWTVEAHEYEVKLREQAGEASVLTVDGQPVARRHVLDQQIRAHTRHMDYFKRIGGKNSE